MKIKEMTDRHLANAIRYWKRQLACQPEEQYYMGDSDYVESVVESENEQNRIMAEKIDNLITRLEKEAKLRKLID